ncbi:actin depolymerizing protein, partial [Tricholoma matsutake]
SGVQVSQQAKDAFADLKEGRKHKYVIFNLSPDNREVEVLKASSSPDYDEFLKDLPEDQCRWAVYDLEFEKPDGGRRTKLCFFSWTPDTAKIKQKMVFASSRAQVQRALTSASSVIDIQATDEDEVSFES